MFMGGSILSVSAVFVLAAAGPVVADPSGSPLQQVQQELHVERPVYEGPTLTLQSTLDEALTKNPELIALRKQFEATRLRPAQERFLSPPMLEAQIWQWPVTSVNPLDTNMYMFMVTQDLPGRGKRALKAAVAEKDVEMSENAIAVRARQVVGDVKSAYAALFVARRAIDVHLDGVDLLRQFADLTEAKYAAGRISQQDVLKAVVELSKVHDDLVTMYQQAQRAAAQLNTLLDRRPDAPIGPLAEPHERVLLPVVAELQALALRTHPELRAAHLEFERAQAEVAVAKRDYKPDFSVQSGYMLTPRGDDGILARVGITWPRAPWSRGKLDLRVAETTAIGEAASARLKAVENGLRLAVQDAYIRVKAAEEHASLLRTSLIPLTEQTVEVARIGYQSDRVDFLALLDNQRGLLGMQLDYVKALSDFEQALADLERAVGTELPPTMISALNTTETH